MDALPACVLANVTGFGVCALVQLRRVSVAVREALRLAFVAWQAQCELLAHLRDEEGFIAHYEDLQTQVEFDRWEAELDTPSWWSSDEDADPFAWSD